jgi:hypothetical protein
MISDGPQWSQRHQEAIIDWVLAHPDARLVDCVREFEVGEDALRKAVGKGTFMEAFEQRLVAEWRVGRGHPTCPRCSGRASRIYFGYPDWEWLHDPLQALWYAAKHYRLGGCVVDSSREWHCIQCEHEWA